MNGLLCMRTMTEFIIWVCTHNFHKSKFSTYRHFSTQAQRKQYGVRIYPFLGCCIRASITVQIISRHFHFPSCHCIRYISNYIYNYVMHAVFVLNTLRMPIVHLSIGGKVWTNCTDPLLLLSPPPLRSFQIIVPEEEKTTILNKNIFINSKVREKTDEHIQKRPK